MTAPARTATTRWPGLPLEDWSATKETLHRYAQVLGKIRLALTPFRNHWWHTTLYVDTRGLTTGPMPTGDGRDVTIDLDVLDSAAVVVDSAGATDRFDLLDRPACADFYAQVFAALARMGVDVGIRPQPFDLDGPLLSRDRVHAAYDPEAVGRYWTVLRSSAHVLGEFAGWFNGKQSPVHLFWHSFDLALARFSGLAAPPRPGADTVTAEAYSHEVIAFGFWPGDAQVPYPAYYSYTAPAPDGLTDQPLQPAAARWIAEQGTAHLAYDDVRASADPRATLLSFLASAYAAGARTAGWDAAAFASRAAPAASG